MPGKIKVKVLAGRNLPVMDRAGETTDAFVEVKFGNITHKTDVCRKSLNPHWSSTEWYRFEVDESELQDEPLQLRLMDHDTYSANDAIGKVVISLAPLLAREVTQVKGATAAAPSGGSIMSGWIPVFDTMHGIRGELNVIVKVELFSDFNKYKTSSCDVQFFHCTMIPPGYKATAVHGFVEELVVNDDPEYQWIDKIRTPRASNEARQVAFIKLSNQVQRLVGLKAAELGANAVVGYQQDFDLEGEAGVVARAIGTAITITPLPTFYQAISIPLCTQQQLKKYLDILATDTESITDLNQYFQNHQDELQNLLKILNPKTPTLLDEPDNPDDDEKPTDLTRQSSIKSYVGNISIYRDDYVSQKSLRHISDDQTDLNKLLKRNEDSDSDSSGPLQKIKKFKTNFFTKKFGGSRCRKSDKQDDQISIQSNSSDTSRISLTDIRNEFKKFKRLKKPKFRKAFVNKEDEGIGMASILARSVIHVHTSLACIAETQDSEQSPCSTMRRTSESEPTINMSDEDKVRTDTALEPKNNIPSDTKNKVPEIHTSLKNISTDEDDAQMPHRKLSESCPTTPIASRSENLLKLPGETGYFGSLSLSGDSSEIYSSSDEDDESSDQKTDTSVETTSSIVQSVMNQQRVDASLLNKMDKKLCILKGDVVIAEPDLHKSMEEQTKHNNNHGIITSLGSVSIAQEIIKNNNKSIEANTETISHASVSTDTHIPVLVRPKPDNNYHFKFHNPFSHKNVSKSISAPSSPTEKSGFMYRSSKRIKSQLSKISKSNMIKSLSHYSLIPKKKQTESKVTMSQPGSDSDVLSKIPSHETVLGSRFLSYADLLCLEKQETDTLKLFHKSDELDHAKVTMYIGSEPVSRASLSGVSSYMDEGHQVVDHKSVKKDKIALKSTGLVHTAMETILIDKVQSLLVPTSPEPILSKERQFFDDVNEKLEKVEVTRKSKEVPNLKIGSLSPKHKKHSLVHTAIETILMDKVQYLLPSTPDKLQSEGQQLYDNNPNPTTDTANEPGLVFKEIETEDRLDTETSRLESFSVGKENDDNLVNTVMKTMLMDKVQSLIPSTSVSTESVLLENQQKIDGSSSSTETKVPRSSTRSSLLHNAVETILIDKVQSLLPPTALESVQTTEVQICDENKNSEKMQDQSSLLHSAMETVLMDKFATLLIPTTYTESACQQQQNSNQTLTELVDTTSVPDKKEKKLVRQDSIHSVTETSNESRKMSKEYDANLVIPSKMTKNKPVLQHFHPLLSGSPLETIPSLPEGSLDHTESLDIEGVERTCECQSECNSETNSASVCGNSHAACRFNRSERETEKIEKDKASPRHTRHESYGGREPVTSLQQSQTQSLHSTSTPVAIHRRSSDSDLSVTPKGGSLNTSLGNTGSGGAILRPSMNSNNLDLLEYPFLTMTEYPPGFIVHIGGTVCSRSVKLVDAGGESAARAAWWAELRTELRAHARALRCNAVIAYSESAAICEDVCVLSASGTAAMINLDCDLSNFETGETPVSVTPEAKSAGDEPEPDTCGMAHVPYSPGAGPYRAELSTCGGCRRARVPAVLLATCAKPTKLPSFAKAVTLTAVAARIRRAPPASEPGARDISDQLPFLEYELHKLLLAKLRMQGANALFSLQTQIAIGERCVMALASGTAVRLAALPPPTPPRVKASEKEKDAVDIQRSLWDAFITNKTANGYDIDVREYNPNGALPDLEGEEAPALDLSSDKDACVLELDEAEDVETAKGLSVRRTYMEVYANGMKAAPVVPPHAFAQVWRARLVLSGQGSGASAAAERHVSRALDGVVYKLRRLQPCALVTPRFQIELPEDEIQLVLSGAAIQLLDPNKPELSPVSADPPESPEFDADPSSSTRDSCDLSQASIYDNDDDIFSLDEEQLIKLSPTEVPDDRNLVLNLQSPPPAVAMTSLAYIGGSKTARRICGLRLLFVRETTAVRELGGLSGFLHTFTCEVLSIARSYTAALGGNALTSFYMKQLMLQDNAHKNQGQCLLSVGGDVVQITY